jgi:hypothetical protein
MAANDVQVYEPTMYAFIMLCNAVKFRKKTGQSMIRGQEARMAQNYGWSASKRFCPSLIEDLNSLREGLGMPAI